MAINRKEIIDQLSKLKVEADSNGIIESFNVLINQFPGELWTNFAERLTGKVPNELLEPTEYLLYNAAHECGYHTSYGIITSPEWNSIVAPMVEKVPEDILHGAFAVITAFGWANSEIIELIPNEKMVVRSYDYYESDSIIHGESRRVSAYMLSGICAGAMDLAYGGNYDATGKTSLNTFQCKQTKGIETGDQYGEFVVTKG